VPLPEESEQSVTLASGVPCGVFAIVTDTECDGVPRVTIPCSWYSYRPRISSSSAEPAA
jgi:hypothetical protein